MKPFLRALTMGVLIAAVLVAQTPLTVLATDQSTATQSDVSGEAKIERLRRESGKLIEVILEEQRLVAWENGRMVMSTLVSTGTRTTPTPKGTFRISRKYEKQRLVGPGYDLPNVPWVMYFRKGGYALHGTYWHNNFGQPMSRGCVNLPTESAAWLYQWAPNGTTVVVR